MHCKKLLASVLALAIAGSASLAMAQDAPAPGQPTAGQTMPQGQRMHAHSKEMARMHGDRHGGMNRRHGFHSAAFADLHALERLYREAGRTRELTALYNDVLAKTQNPMLRTYVYHRLARLQMQPTNVDQAAATLRKSLDENLAIEAKHRAELEKMRSEWQQRRAAAAPTSN